MRIKCNQEAILKSDHICKFAHLLILFLGFLKIAYTAIQRPIMINIGAIVIRVVLYTSL